MTSFANRYRQAWRTWVDWPVFRVMVWVMALQWLAQLAEMRLNHIRTYTIGVARWIGYVLTALDFFDHIVPALLALVVPMMIVWRLKSQMSDWRSALMPRFRLPHLAAAALIAGAIFLFMAVLPVGLSL